MPLVHRSETSPANINYFVKEHILADLVTLLYWQAKYERASTRQTESRRLPFEWLEPPCTPWSMLRETLSNVVGSALEVFDCVSQVLFFLETAFGVGSGLGR